MSPSSGPWVVVKTWCIPVLVVSMIVVIPVMSMVWIFVVWSFKVGLRVVWWSKSALVIHVGLVVVSASISSAVSNRESISILVTLHLLVELVWIHAFSFFRALDIVIVYSVNGTSFESLLQAVILEGVT